MASYLRAETAPSSSVDESTKTAEVTQPVPPQTRPKYLNLRYDDDFSYLDGTIDSYKKDFFDPIKNIHLGEDWRLSLGGEFRYQFDVETNKSFGSTEPTTDEFSLDRFLLHADFKYHKLFRVFVQGITASDIDRDLMPRPTDENKWDLQQLFFDLRLLGEEQPWTLRVGRQELSYGNERFVSPAEWTNVRRRFDAVKLFARFDKWDIDVWYAKPVIVQREQHDRFDEDVDFNGMYVSFKGIPRHGVDAYALALDDTGHPTNPNGNTGDRDVYTLGSRFWGKTAGFDYETEVAGQWGHWASDNIEAWSTTVDGGYTFEDVPWKPRLGSGFDWASGDNNPFDRKVGTFNQLFPLGHKYFGFLDLIGRQNITDWNVNLSSWPVSEKVRTAMAFHAFWLADEEDALYNVSGQPGRRDPTGRSSSQVGNELDITVQWKIDVHSTLLVGYSHFWHDDFIVETGVSEDADLFYVQYAFKF